MRVYFGIGVERISKSVNVGTLMRTAHAFGAGFVFTVDAVYSEREGGKSDTSGATGHVPYYAFADVAAKSSPGVRGNVLYAKGTPGPRSSTRGGSSTRDDSGASGKVKIVVEPDPDWQQALARAQFDPRVWKTDFSLHTVPCAEIRAGNPQP